MTRDNPKEMLGLCWVIWLGEVKISIKWLFTWRG